MEICEALRQRTPVILVLVGGATLPAESEVPADIRPLLDRNRVELRDDHWVSDVDELISGLGKLVPALRARDLGGLVASRRHTMVILIALSTAVTAGHIVLVRLDLLDAYTLRVLPGLLVLIFAVLAMAHVAIRRSR
jgi:hypothetical protein